MAMRRPTAYVPLSTLYFDDDAIMEAGEDAELLFVRMLAYAARIPQTEGFIADRVVLSRLGILPRESGNGTGTDAGTVPGTDAGSRAGKLVEVGLLTREPGGYRIRSWLKWNRSAAESSREQARDRYRKQATDKGVSGTDAGSRAGSRAGTDAGSRAGIPTTDTDTDTDTDSLRSSGGSGGKISPSTAVALAEDSVTADAAPPTKRGTRLDPGWQPDRTDANLRSEAGHPADWLSRELERFRDYWKAKTGKDATKIDWNATWRNWIRNAEDRQPTRRARTAGSLTEAEWQQMMAGKE